MPVHYRERAIAAKFLVKVCVGGFRRKAVVDWYPRLVRRLVVSVRNVSRYLTVLAGIAIHRWWFLFIQFSNKFAVNVLSSK